MDRRHQAHRPPPLGLVAGRLVPLDFARDAIYEVLRICLLGAAYDLALRRTGLAGGPSAPPAEPEPVTART